MKGPTSFLRKIRIISEVVFMVLQPWEGVCALCRLLFCPEVSEETARKKAKRMPGRSERPPQPKQRTESCGLAHSARQQ